MLSHEEFEQLVKEGINAIDEKFLAKLKNVEIVIEDNPTPFQAERLKIRGALLFGLYEGIPLTKRENYGQVLPDKITIFKNSIETFIPEKCIALTGKVSLRNGEKSIIIEGVKEV